jgi:chemotaxis protein methyltransferase CheR
MTIKIKDDELALLARYIHEASGIHIDSSKSYLLEARLGELLGEFRLNSYFDLYQKAKSAPDKFLQIRIIDAISTNETLFFRDIDTFNVLQNKIIPDLIDARSFGASTFLPIPLRIWSAGCSTGQEVYSIAITLKELLGDMKKYRLKLLGTDISDAAIGKASYGLYNRFEVERGTSPSRLMKYFTASGSNWKINDEIRSMALFKRFNLIEPFDPLGKYDVIFCRNVAIYFGINERKRLFEKIADVLEPDGALVIGASESLAGVCPLFEPKHYLRSIFYQLKKDRKPVNTPIFRSS